MSDCAATLHISDRLQTLANQAACCSAYCYAPVAGFVNLTSLRLRGKGYAPSAYDIAWHAECGYGDMSYSLRSLQNLTAPACGGTRYACRARCSASCMACLETTRLEHRGSAD